MSCLQKKLAQHPTTVIHCGVSSLHKVLSPQNVGDGDPTFAPILGQNGKMCLTHNTMGNRGNTSFSQ